MSDTNQRPPPPGKAESLFAAWAARIEAGERIEFESVVRRHPECARELEQLHDDWLQFAPLLSRVVPGLVASESGVLVPPLASAKDDDAPPSSDELFARLGLHGAGESRYRFRAVIGRGGGGVVLRVWDSKLNRALAMKVVLGREEERLSGDTPRVDGRTLSRFVDEARIAAQLNHPGIVPVHELGADDAGRAFFTMKLVKGENLACIFEKVFTGEGDWNQPRALGYLLRVCEAMAYAHDKGVVHRDLKPANVMVGPYGEVHVMDWGLARVLGEKDTRDLRIRPQPQPPISAVDSFRAGERKAQADSPLITMDGAAVGTPAYMSPEQARGELEDVGPRSDVYAVGAMLYHLLTGEPPFTPRGAHAPQLVVLTNVMHGPPKPVEELSPRAAPELVAICEKAMQRQSTSRYGSMLELAADLRAFLEGRVVEAYETGTWAETKKWVQRNKALAVSLLVTVLAIAALIVALIWAFAQQKHVAEVAQANERRAMSAEADVRAAKAQAEALARASEESDYVAALGGVAVALKASEPTIVRQLLDSVPERLRNWEWRYLDASSDTSLLKLEGQTPSWSPDGTGIVTTLDDFTVCLWDTASGRELARLEGHTSAVNSASFSPDGARIVTASADETARVWDATRGRELVKLDGHMGVVLSASFSPDGKRVVTGSSDKLGRVWEVEGGRELARLEGHTSDVYSARFSPDGLLIVTTSSPADRFARVWNAQSGQELARLDYDGWHCVSASFSPDGLRVVTAFGEGSVLVWDATGGREPARLPGPRRWCSGASFSPDGTRIVAAFDDGSARVWDVVSSQHVATLHGNSSSAVVEASFSPDGTRIVTACRDGVARVWDASSGLELATLAGHPGGLSSASFSPDGRRVVTESFDGFARVWDAGPGRRKLAELNGHTRAVSNANFSPDGTRIVTASHDNTTRVWDAVSWLELAKLEGHTSRVTDANFSPDGMRIVTASIDDTARVWDAVSWRELAKLEGHSGWVNSASFSPDGERIVTASRDLTARAWDAASGRELAKLNGHSSTVNGARFSPDGTRIVTASDDGTARVWDAASWRELTTLVAHTSSVTSACFSPDGARIVTASMDETARVWDAASGRELANLKHTRAVLSASFSPDGGRIVTASEDRTVRVWDAVSWRELAKLEGHTHWVRSASFSLDGTRLITASDDGSARIWDSVPYRRRSAEYRALEEALPQGERKFEEEVVRSGDFLGAYVHLRDDPSIDPILRRAALNALSRRSASARELAKALESKRCERTWVARMLGREAWQTEGDIELRLPAAQEALIDPENSRAWRDPNAPPDVRLEFQVLAEVVRTRDPSASLDDLDAALHEIVARALFSLGHFDEALAKQRDALDHADERWKADYQRALERMEAEIAEWRDENGQLRVAKWTAKLEELDRQIAELEADPDVRMWLAYKR